MMWFALSRGLAEALFMVEMWELEWNSSMMQHGVDMGTMEFISRKVAH